MIAFQVSDMTCSRCACAITRAIKAVDPSSRVAVDLATFTVEIEPAKASAKQLSA
jgi:copper chaperone